MTIQLEQEGFVPGMGGAWVALVPDTEQNYNGDGEFWAQPNDTAGVVLVKTDVDVPAEAGKYAVWYCLPYGSYEWKKLDGTTVMVQEGTGTEPGENGTGSGSGESAPEGGETQQTPAE